MSDCGWLLADAGRPNEGLPLLGEAVAQLAEFRRDGSMETAKARIRLARCLADMDRPEEARTALASALPVVESYLAPDHPLLRLARRTQAGVGGGTARSDGAGR